jgi:hypothetical protein
MSEKPDKLIPRLFRFTEDDIRMIGELRELDDDPSDAFTMRRSIRFLYGYLIGFSENDPS